MWQTVWTPQGVYVSFPVPASILFECFELFLTNIGLLQHLSFIKICSSFPVTCVLSIES